MAGTYLCGRIGERAPTCETHRAIGVAPTREAPVVRANGAFKVRIGGDCDSIRLASCDVASQQPDDSRTSRGELERPEHDCGTADGARSRLVPPSQTCRPLPFCSSFVSIILRVGMHVCCLLL